MRALRSTKKLSVDETSESSLTWMTTFSDLLMLLLTIFVMRLSMSSIETPEIIKMIRSFQETLALGSNMEGSLPSEETAEANLQSTQNKEAESSIEIRLADALSSVSSEKTEGDALKGGPNLDPDIQIESRDGGTVVLLGSSFFDSASDALSFKAQEAIRAVSAIAKEEKAYVFVSGHTDNVPIANNRFPSNWELSSSRAIAVVRQMIDAGVNPQYLRAVGYADVKPISDNQNPTLRHLNRRVEIFFSRE